MSYRDSPLTIITFNSLFWAWCLSQPKIEIRIPTFNSLFWAWLREMLRGIMRIHTFNSLFWACPAIVCYCGDGVKTFNSLFWAWWGSASGTSSFSPILSIPSFGLAIPKPPCESVRIILSIPSFGLGFSPWALCHQNGLLSIPSFGLVACFGLFSRFRVLFGGYLYFSFRCILSCRRYIKGSERFCF